MKALLNGALLHSYPAPLSCKPPSHQDRIRSCVTYKVLNAVGVMHVSPPKDRVADERPILPSAYDQWEPLGMILVNGNHHFAHTDAFA
jgi:hypothetical protein